tara:strand:+ start:133 stop:960 length:828 start_codon:yes stop_codon:yes gene_type:complete
MIGKGNIMVAFERALNKSYLILESLEDLDMEFMASAEKCTAFSINPKEYESELHKKEIRYLFTKRYFPSFDISKFDNVNDISSDWQAYNSIIKEFRKLNSSAYDNNIHPKEGALGPGEKAMYYVIKNAVLAGGGSGGDLRVGNTTYEIKAVDFSKGYVFNFKTGGTFSVADTMQDIMKLKEKYMEELGFSGKLSEVKITEIRTLRDSKQSKKEFAKIEKQYQNNAHAQYFSHYPFIWIKNNAKNKGEILGVTEPKKKDIIIQTVTSGTVKPMVKL